LRIQKRKELNLDAETSIKNLGLGRNSLSNSHTKEGAKTLTIKGLKYVYFFILEIRNILAYKLEVGFGFVGRTGMPIY